MNRNGLFILIVGAALSAQAAEKVYSFDTDPVNRPPIGFSAGDENWRVVADHRASSPPNVLQSPRSVLSGGSALTLLADKTVFLNGDVGLHFRFRADDKPGTFGVLWRYKDAQNFYAAQIDTASESVYILRTVAGKPKILSQEQTLLTPVSWHSFQVQVSGNRFTVIVDDLAVTHADDKNLKEPGKVGLLSSPGDSLQFDDFAFRSL